MSTSPYAIRAAFEEACFFEAKAHALIDYLKFENDFARPIPAGLTGTVCTHGTGFTVHDPQPGDLPCLRGFRLIGAEVSIDLKPSNSVKGLDRDDHLDAIFKYVTARIWPIGFGGIARSYRVSPAVEVGYEPYSLDEDGNATDPRLPCVGETEYVGDRLGDETGRDNPAWAQMRIYRKAFDQKQPLPARSRCIRVEITLGHLGLRELEMFTAEEVAGFAFRPMLSQCFRLLRLDAALAVTPPVHSRKAKSKRLSARARAFSKAARAAAIAVLKERVRDGGLLGVMNDPGALINTRARDVRGNAKLGVALDNLTRRFRPSVSV